ncbi:Receptor-interacting serine/threonine-protein kinase 4, partial [Dermatophagoides pteronyssinus]
MNNCETIAATTTTLTSIHRQSPSFDNHVHHHQQSSSSMSTSTAVATSSSSSSLYQPIPIVHQCIINTQLANHQSTRQQEESYQNKILLAKKILKLIQNNDYEQFSRILLYKKPDLNVFINGQTALHYCLLLGRDVSWCKLLVLNGANPNLSNQDGWHPLHLAAFRGLKES